MIVRDPFELPAPKEPYRGILPFRLLDWRIFFERDAETERLTNLVSLYRGVLLYGQSGAGKSSLLNAGLIPQALRQGRAPERIRVYPECGNELSIEPILVQEKGANGTCDERLEYLDSRFIPAASGEQVRLPCDEFEAQLKRNSNLGAPLLIFDQFEELATLFEENPKDRIQFDKARAARAAIERLLYDLLLNESLRVKVIFAFRDDYLARLTPLFSRIPNLMDQAVRLALPQMDLLHHIVRGPFIPSKERGIEAGQFGDELSEELAQKIEGGIRTSQPSGVLNLSEVQTMCLALWKESKLRAELLRTKNPPAVLRRIIRSEAMSNLKKKFWVLNRIRAIAVLSNLVTEDGTRNVVAQQMLISQTRRNPMLWVFRGKWRRFLERLSETGLVRRSLTGTIYHYELTSEFLIPQIQRWQQNLRRQRQVIVAITCVILIAVPWWLLQRARSAEQKATEAKQAADDLISVMEYDVTNSLRSSGQIRMAEKINNKVIEYYDKYPPKPDDSKAMISKGLALVQKGNLHYWNGHFDEALTQLGVGVEIFRSLVEKTGEAECKVALWLIEEQIGDNQVQNGNLAGALVSYSESGALAEKFVDKNDQYWTDFRQEHVAVLFDKIGNAQMRQGKLREALANYQKSMAIVQDRIKKGTNAANQTIEPDTREKIGDAELAQGNLAEARRSYEAALVAATNVADKDFTNVVWQDAVATKLEKMGDVLRDQGNLSDAAKKYDESLAIRQKLAKQDPNEPWWQSRLSNTLERIGNVLRDQDNIEAALDNYRKSLMIRQELERLSAWWQSDLCSSYEKIGDVFLDQQNVEKAVENYSASQRKREELTKLDPTNAWWQSDLSRSYDKIGDVLRMHGNLDGALKNYRDAVRIREILVSLDNSNARYQADLAYSYFHVGMTQAKAQPNPKEDTQAMMQKGRDILRDLKKRNALTAEQQKWLDEIESELIKAGRRDSG
jgi:tetratricopeptide (TPR) repeat protein